MKINDWLISYMIDQFDQYICSATYFTIPWIDIQIPWYQTQDGKEKVKIAQEIIQELAVIVQHTDPDIKGRAQTLVDITILNHKEALEKSRIDAASQVQKGTLQELIRNFFEFLNIAPSPMKKGKLEKIIQSYFHLLKTEGPKVQAYSDSFLVEVDLKVSVETDFVMVSFKKQDSKKRLITFLVKQYFMCCVELERQSILNGDQSPQSIAEDAHFQILRQLIFDTLASNTLKENNSDLIRVIDELSNTVSTHAILSKKTETDPFLKHFLREINLLKVNIESLMKEASAPESAAAEPAGNTAAAAKSVVSITAAAAMQQPAGAAVAAGASADAAAAAAQMGAASAAAVGPASPVIAYAAAAAAAAQTAPLANCAAAASLQNPTSSPNLKLSNDKTLAVTDQGTQNTAGQTLNQSAQLTQSVQSLVPSLVGASHSRTPLMGKILGDHLTGASSLLSGVHDSGNSSGTALQASFSSLSN